MNGNISNTMTAKRILELKKENRLTMKELAEKLEISESAVKNYIYGRSLPPLETLYKMVIIFKVDSLDDIVVFE